MVKDWKKKVDYEERYRGCIIESGVCVWGRWLYLDWDFDLEDIVLSFSDLCCDVGWIDKCVNL